MPFAPGQSGNPDGTKTPKRFMAALTRAIAQDDGKRLRETAETLLTKASEGEPWAVQMLADRLDGKAAQTTTLAGDPEHPLQLVQREIVRAGG